MEGIGFTFARVSTVGGVDDPGKREPMQACSIRRLGAVRRLAGNPFLQQTRISYSQA
jgi:hypothetical protein